MLLTKGRQVKNLFHLVAKNVCFKAEKTACVAPSRFIADHYFSRVSCAFIFGHIQSLIHSVILSSFRNGEWVPVSQNPEKLGGSVCVVAVGAPVVQ